MAPSCIITAVVILIIILAAGLYGYRYQHSLRTPGVSAAVTWETVAPGHYHGELSGAGGLQFIDSSMDGQAEPFPRRLPDGSVATLSYGSSLRYGAHFKDSAREVWLQGQACFDVAKDPRHPLLVHVGTATVKVLGTRFNCMNYPGTTGEITVLSGSVRVQDGTESKDLQSAQRALIRQAQGQEGLTTTITVQEADHPNNSIAWMDANPSIESDDEELFSLVGKLAYYYHVGARWPPTVKAVKVTASLSLRNSLRQNVAIINAGLKDIRLDIKDGGIDVTSK
jgi:ferric-dicitrate binding protein FerR (iron transport regulator)